MKRIIDIDGIKLENKMYYSKTPSSTNRVNDEAFALAKKYVKKSADKLKKAKFKKVQVMTMGEYYYAKSKAGKVIPITTMHLIRLLKR